MTPFPKWAAMVEELYFVRSKRNSRIETKPRGIICPRAFPRGRVEAIIW